MAIEGGLPDWRNLRAALRQLQWGDGLTRDEMTRQVPELRTSLMRVLPAGFRFPNAGAVLSYFEKVAREGQLRLPETEPPQGYGERSTTGLTVAGHAYPPTVGGGYGSGNTGSSAQTGVDRRGVLYPDHHP